MYKIYALLPRLASYAGHEYAYHISLEEGLKQRGWDCSYFYPKNANISPPNINWHPYLANDLDPRPKGVFSKLFIFFANIFPFRKIFQTCRNEKDSVIFIEQFEPCHLASILIALLFIKPQFHFWILHHYPLEELSRKTKLYRWIHDWVEQKIGLNKFKCLTDSELIEWKNKQSLKRIFQTVPIPHTTHGNLKKIKSEEVFIWLPGNAMRSDKGFKIIQKFSEKITSFPQIKFALSENVRNFLNESNQWIFLPNYLSPEEYATQMNKAHLIFLPYDPIEFKYRTSGIFVEAICADVIPVVTKGTWMAHELEKFSLGDLTFDWQEINIIQKLFGLLSSEEENFSLSSMRQNYRAYHCRKNMAQVMEQFIWNQGK